MKKIFLTLFILFMGIGEMFAQEEDEPIILSPSNLQKSPDKKYSILASYDNVSKSFEFYGSYLYPIPYCVYNENGNIIQSGVCEKNNSYAYSIDLYSISTCQISIEIMIQGVLFMGSFQV